MSKMIAWEKQPAVKRGFVKVERDIPEITPDEVLVKILAAGICGTDLSIYEGKRKVPDNLIPGHEFIAEIVKLGDNVRGFEVGDWVIPSIINRCAVCWPCINGFDGQCYNLEEIGIHIDGSFSEYAAIPKATLHKVSKDIDIVVGASVEPVAVGYSAVQKVGQLILGKYVMVYGPGPIGLYISQLAKLAGAAKVVLVGTKDPRLQLAKENYGIETINLNKENVKEKLKEYFPQTSGKADIIFEATGVADAVGEMASHLAPRGELILTGIFKELSAIDSVAIVRNESCIRGSFCYTLSEFEYAIKLATEGKINFDGIIETVGLDQLDVGVEKEISREAIKVVAINGG